MVIPTVVVIPVTLFRTSLPAMALARVKLGYESGAYPLTVAFKNPLVTPLIISGLSTAVIYALLIVGAINLAPISLSWKRVVLRAVIVFPSRNSISTDLPLTPVLSPAVYT